MDKILTLIGGDFIRQLKTRKYYEHHQKQMWQREGEEGKKKTKKIIQIETKAEDTNENETMKGN